MVNIELNLQNSDLPAGRGRQALQKLNKKPGAGIPKMINLKR
jgi:hypothetical protein